ncbi:MAG: VWA domain-containing protein [Alphaproteobacteria bacterium]|nr:VWA domain-containing protein [Alphaproteobacteria bacterium]
MTISLIPTIGVIGIATDVSRAYIVKTRLRAALDAAALAGGRSFFDADRGTQIKKYFNANFPPGYFGTTVKGPLEVNATGTVYPPGHIYNQKDTVLRLTASASIPTLFMKLFSFKDMSVGGDSEVTRQTSFLDVVIAVDMSGSMLRTVSGSWSSSVQDRRIELAKTAATNLVDILFGSTQENALLSIGLVPWAGKVKVTESGTRYGYDANGNSIPHSALFTTKNVPSSPDNPYKEAFYRIDKHNDGNIWNNADDLVLKNWTPKITKVYYAHNAPSVPLLAEPPADWKGYVYARYARTKPYNAPQSYSDYTAEAEAGDLVAGPFTSPGGPAWVGWYPMGDEGQTTYCDLGLLNGGKYYCSSGPAAGILPLQHNKATIENAKRHP